MTATQRRDLFSPSPVFFGLCLLTVALGTLLWQGFDPGGAGVFLFVLAGWVVSLTLHEFGHAVVAYIGGDHSVAHKGYLTLDVRRYADPGLSLLFPVIILAIGGIALPGGAVWINRSAIRSLVMRSLTSAAGPAANLVVAAICLLPIRAGWVGLEQHFQFALGLAFLGFVQVMALILNLVPIPGFDGYGILEPHLSYETKRSLEPLQRYGIMIFIAALWFIPAVRDRFWDITEAVAEVLGGRSIEFLWQVGWREFQFWR